MDVDGVWLILDIPVSSSSSLSSHGLLSLFVVILSLSLSPLFSSLIGPSPTWNTGGSRTWWTSSFSASLPSFEQLYHGQDICDRFWSIFTRLRLRDHGFAWGMGVFCGYGGMVHSLMLLGRKSSTQNKQTYFRNCARDSRDMGHTKENEKYW